MFAKLKSALLPPALVVIGIVLAIGGYQDGRNFKAIANHGKTAEATVDQVTWKEKAISGREKGFKIDVHFQTEDKQTVNTTLSVSKAEGQRFRDTPDDKVMVKYLPEAPQTVILANAKDDSVAMEIAGAVMALVGIGIFVYRRKRKVVEVAEPAAA